MTWHFPLTAFNIISLHFWHLDYNRLQRDSSLTSIQNSQCLLYLNVYIFPIDLGIFCFDFCAFSFISAPSSLLWISGSDSSIYSGVLRWCTPVSLMLIFPYWYLNTVFYQLCSLFRASFFFSLKPLFVFVFCFFPFDSISFSFLRCLFFFFFGQNFNFFCHVIDFLVHFSDFSSMLRTFLSKSYIEFIYLFIFSSRSLALYHK